MLLRIVELTIGYTSIFFSFSILSILLYKRIKKIPSLQGFEFELIFNLSIASILNLLSFLIHFIEKDYEPEKLCQIQGILMIIFELSQDIWSSLIIYYIYINIISVHNIQTDIYKKLCYYILGYLLPLIFSLTCFFFNMIGPSGYYCWIMTNEKRILNQVFELFDFSFGWILLFINFFHLVMIQKYKDKNNSKYFKRSCVYPFMQSICLLPPTINRIYFLIYNQYIDKIVFVQILLYSLQCFVYCVTYISNPEIKKILVDLFFQIFCFFKKKNYFEIRNSERFLINSDSNASFNY